MAHIIVCLAALLVFEIYFTKQFVSYPNWDKSTTTSTVDLSECQRFLQLLTRKCSLGQYGGREPLQYLPGDRSRSAPEEKVCAPRRA